LGAGSTPGVLEMPVSWMICEPVRGSLITLPT